ncbi:hypothetical protein LOTGIDRAFT_233860 [Lottia gigantea]|uniref:Threonine synthase N-terminal domain-containing protein n=1 Tax=Lottia gigantea TaxID=225164 RepID=V3ZGP7_LOTGI|nr:hypothetical protein LOTGIDRAFT_233860 [Lottia gigantea]ESO90383.1 hypothetical protein LOTGIDRAFT_233860 [Lottia gigantea]
MKYRSTRGGIKGVSLEEAIYTGFASDGGLLLPETLPVIDRSQLKLWAQQPDYRSLACKIVPLFAGDELSQEDLEGILDRAYSSISAPEKIPIRRLSNNLIIAELFHGRTWSFKDYAMSVMGQLLEHFLSRAKKHRTLLIADGSSDDMDDLFSHIYADEKFVKQHNISSLNSVNWGRIMLQIVHYFYIYLQIEESCEKELEIVVPTGGCGNVTAGCIAKLMGLPIRLTSCVNENDTVDRLIKTGTLSLNPVKQTISPSLDIQMPYNMERIWFLLNNGDGEMINKIMTELKTHSKCQLPDSLHTELTKIFGSFSADEDAIKSTIKRCYDENKYTICPHTAVGVAYHYHQLQKNTEADVKRVELATASPAKFPEALGLAGVPPTEGLPQYQMDNLEKGDDWLKALKQTIISIDERWTV